VRASRVQVRPNSLVGQIFHVPDGVQRLMRNDIYRGRTPERYYDALDWIFSAAGLRQEFRRKQLGAELGRRARAAELHRRTSSVCRISSARRAPGSPPAMQPKSVARPVSTACAPARAPSGCRRRGALPPSSRTVILLADDRRNGRQRVQRRRRAVELPAAVVRDDDAVAADRDRALASSGRSTPLSSSLPGHSSRSA
jgi:hypothetical protein